MLFEHIISLIAPHRCIACNKEGTLLCDLCMQRQKLAAQRCFICQHPSAEGKTCMQCAAATSIGQVRSSVAYQGSVKDLLWRLKAERANAAAQIMGYYCSRLVVPGKRQLITYIPTAPIRVRQRGYDQAKLIARAVAQYSNTPMVPLLARVSSQRQVGADRQERRNQLSGAFRLRNGFAAQNQNIIIIDDVITTGSSIREAGKILATAQPASISAITFAQA